MTAAMVLVALAVLAFALTRKRKAKPAGVRLFQLPLPPQPLRLGDTLTARIAVTGSFQPIEQSDQPDQPAVASLMIQRTGSLYDMNSRWYTRKAWPLVSGTLSAVAEPDAWGNVEGKSDPAAFSDALANVERAYVVFGQEAGRAHGVQGNKGASATLAR